MGAVAIGFGLAHIIVVIVALWVEHRQQNDRPDLPFAAAFLLMSWVLSALSVSPLAKEFALEYGDSPYMGFLILAPILDLAGTIFCVALAVRRWEVWKMTLAFLFFCACVVHPDFHIGQVALDGALSRYVRTLNLIVVAELGVVLITGGWYVARASLLSLCRRLRLRHHLGNTARGIL